MSERAMSDEAAAAYSEYVKAMNEANQEMDGHWAAVADLSTAYYKRHAEATRRGQELYDNVRRLRAVYDELMKSEN